MNRSQWKLGIRGHLWRSRRTKDDASSDGRVFVSTYQTVMGLIDSGDDELRRLGPGYIDASAGPAHTATA